MDNSKVRPKIYILLCSRWNFCCKTLCLKIYTKSLIFWEIFKYCVLSWLRGKMHFFSSGFDGWNMTNDKFRSSNVTYIVRVELSNKKFKENRIRRHFKRFWLPGAVWVERSVRDQNIYNRWAWALLLLLQYKKRKNKRRLFSFKKEKALYFLYLWCSQLRIVVFQGSGPSQKKASKPRWHLGWALMLSKTQWSFKGSSSG